MTAITDPSRCRPKQTARARAVGGTKPALSPALSPEATVAAVQTDREIGPPMPDHFTASEIAWLRQQRKSLEREIAAKLDERAESAVDRCQHPAALPSPLDLTASMAQFAWRFALSSWGLI